MKILLFGSNGQLGFELQRSLCVLGELESVARHPNAMHTIDLCEADQVEEVIRKSRPHVVVNAAAYTAVDQAEREPELASKINALAVKHMANAASEVGAFLVHFSTDYVFSGETSTPWTERDPTLPRSVYGKSKLEAERLLIASGCAHWILRVQSLYGARSQNFLQTMLRKAREGAKLNIVDDQFCAPTPVRWVAASLNSMLGQWLRSARPQQLSGVYHLASQGQCSWLEFALAIFERAQALKLIERIPEVRATSAKAFGAPAERPAFSVFNCEKITRDFDLKLGHWSTGMQQVLEEMAERA